MWTASPDASAPTLYECRATSKEDFLDLEGYSRSVSLQNTGPNTLWISLDRITWFYVAAGTSCGGDKALLKGFWYCTQTGWTTFMVSDTTAARFNILDG